MGKEWPRSQMVFVEGLVRDGNRWFFYYGVADK